MNGKFISLIGEKRELGGTMAEDYFLPKNANHVLIRQASDQLLIRSYSDAPFDYDEDVYDEIAIELAERGLLEE